MRDIIPDSPAPGAVPIHAATPEGLDSVLESLPDSARNFADSAGFKADSGRILILPGAEGGMGAVLLGLGPAPDVWAFAQACETLPPGDYVLAAAPEGLDRTRIALAWARAAYCFARYKKSERQPPRLALPEGADGDEAARLYAAIALARDLVNTPSSDMGPAELQSAAEQLAAEFGAETRAIVGDELLVANFPMIHAVGRASDRAPRLIELEWGDDSAPRVALVGKGVCFDSGGLDIKSASGMRIMKKDMGGAANALALARLIMSSGLKVRLHVLIAAVDNAISGGAFRPGDVLDSRKGLTVEIDNTDAEGRLVLADALARAGEESPELTLDFATLTGAARVALGPYVVPFYTDDAALAADLEVASAAMDDPIWRMPLWSGYEDKLKSPIADLVNCPSDGFAGSITAALFLRRFIPGSGAWAHFDLYAWNPAARPGRPQGGEAQACLAAYSMLKTRYG